MNRCSNRFHINIIYILLLSACSPSPQSIQTAIAKTQAAWTPTFTLVPSNTLTSTPTTTPTSTPTTTFTSTPEGVLYIVESGFCLMGFGSVHGNPRESYLCSATDRKQYTFHITSTKFDALQLSSNDSSVELFCSIYKLDGTYIGSDLDTIGALSVSCSPFSKPIP
jgi:hypothetical protein